MKKYKHGIAVMRIQPLHHGHVQVISQMLNECQQVTIVIGSAQESGTDKNPFTILDRHRMINNAFPYQLRILSINDINKPDVWAPYVIGRVAITFPYLPIPDIYYAGSDDDGSLFVQAGLNTVIFGRDDLTATKIRDMMNTDDQNWRLHVPSVNIPIIEQYLASRGNHGRLV